MYCYARIETILRFQAESSYQFNYFRDFRYARTQVQEMNASEFRA